MSPVYLLATLWTFAVSAEAAGNQSCVDAADEVVVAVSGGILKSCKAAASFCALDPRLPAGCPQSCGMCDQSNEAPAKVRPIVRLKCERVFICSCVTGFRVHPGQNAVRCREVARRMWQ